jgi:CarboxypepD_reg-like domain
MTKSHLLVIIFIWVTGQVFGQKVIKGKVLEVHSNTAISYANIGIVNSSVGTISNEDGTFLIKIANGHLKDTLTFSALGYIRKSVPVQLVYENKNINIFLKQKETILKEVTVMSKKENQREFDLGNRYYKGGLNLSSAEDATAGASVALLIQNKYPSYHEDLFYPVFLGSAKVRIGDNTIGNFKIRVRLYGVDSLTGLPGNDLLNESLVIESDIKRGWLSFDLSKYNLQVNDSFFIVFEWIMEEKERTELKEIYRQFEELHPVKI